MVARAASLVLLVSLVGCGPTPPGPVVPAASSPSAAPSPAPPADPFAPPADLQREELPAAPPELVLVERALPAAPATVAAPPPACAAYASRRADPSLACREGAGFELLDQAIGRTEPAGRDEALVAAEACTDLPAGLVRALRAELAPTECGDALVEGMLAAPPAGMDGGVYDTLVGLALAARLRRAVGQAPELDPPYDKARVLAFVQGELAAWMREQAAAVQALAAVGAKLRYYARAVVAVEAGMADMRFVEVARSSPVPDEYRDDAELRETYYRHLEMSLDERKQRGRDAALVGLGQLAGVGVIRDPRVFLARQLLGKLYGGRPIDALDALKLPPLAPFSPGTVDERLAARLPTFYATKLFGGDAVRRPSMLRAMLEKGLGLPYRIALAGGTLTTGERALVARGRLELGQAYWRAVDIDELVATLTTGPISADLGEPDRLLLGIGLALHGGPANAADMMLRAPLAELGVGHKLGALDAIASGQGELAGMAAFDAALIAQIAAPAEADATYWQAVASRYRRAAELLVDPLARREAEARAADATETATVIATPHARQEQK